MSNDLKTVFFSQQFSQSNEDKISSSFPFFLPSNPSRKKKESFSYTQTQRLPPFCTDACPVVDDCHTVHSTFHAHCNICEQIRKAECQNGEEKREKNEVLVTKLKEILLSHMFFFLFHSSSFYTFLYMTYQLSVRQWHSQ